MKSIIISGICGKMGEMVYQSAKEYGIKTICGVDKLSDDNFDCPVYNRFESVGERADVVIDFSSPDIQKELLDYCVRTKTPLVLATTGQNEKQLDEICSAADIIPVLKTSNTSPAVNMFIELAGKLAKLLDDYDIEIIETHHRNKKDAPSGTAKQIIKEIEKNRHIENLAVGRNNVARKNGEIGVHSVRGGTVTGEHSVCYFGKYDTVTITHSALSRKLFADGALEAAKFIYDKPAGLYTQSDMKKLF